MKKGQCRGIRKIMAWSMVLVFMVSIIYSNFDRQTAAAAVPDDTSIEESYYQSQLNQLLGEVKNYGVFSDHLTINSDFESNFAANYVTDSGHTVGNTVGSYTNTGGTIYIGQSLSAQGTLQLRNGVDQLVLGSAYSSNRENKITMSNGAVILYANSPNINIHVNSSYLNIINELATVKKVFHKYASQQDTSGISYRYSNNDADLTISTNSSAAGIYVVSITAAQLAQYGYGRLHFEKQAGQILIINVKDVSNSVSISRYYVNGESSVTKNQEINDSIYWNFADYTGNLSIQETCGTIVAPGATVTVTSGGCSGRLIADTAITNQEWHYINTSLDGTYQEYTDDFYIQKSLGGEVENTENAWWINFEAGSNYSNQIVITDEINDTNFHYSDNLQMQYEVTTNGVYGAWTTLTTNTSSADYYTITTQKADKEGGTVEIHVSYAANETVKVRFQVEANDGIYSATTATAQTPDLATNDIASVTYKDANGVGHTYTSADPDQYGSGTNLNTPYVYIERPQDNLMVNKYAVDNGDGTWTLNLEAYILKNGSQQSSSNMTQGDIDLGTQSMIQDYLTDSFVLAGTAQDSVTVTTYDYQGRTQDNQRIFDTNGTDITNTLSITASQNTISVTGYDFNQHSLVEGDTPQGQKIVVSIKIKRSATTYGGNAIETNTTQSGIYSADHVLIKAFPIPSVNVPLLYDIGAHDQSIYITQAVNVADLADFMNINKDGYQMNVAVNGIPNGTNNAYVNIVYHVKNATGEILASYTLKAGTPLSSIQNSDNPFSYLVSNLMADATYTFEVQITSLNAATQGFTQYNTLTDSAQGTVHVFTPTVVCSDTTIFYGDVIDSVMEQVTQVSWSSSDTRAQIPSGNAPQLSYVFTNMKDNSTISNQELVPSEDVNVVISSVKVGSANTDITGFTTIQEADCNADLTHIQNRDFTIHVVKGQLQITKTINEQYTAIQKINANQTFVFRIDQYEVNQDGSRGNKIASFYQIIGFNANENNTVITKTISGLKKGYYTVTEETSWSVKYELTSIKDNYHSVNDSNQGSELFIGETLGTQDGITNYYGLEQTETLLKLAGGEVASASYENTNKEAWRYLSDVAAVVNQFVK